MRTGLKVIALVLSLIAAEGYAQTTPGSASLDSPHRDWHVSWVTHPTAPLREPMVLRFRRALTLEAIPANYRVRVSADNRFVLYVNGQRVGDGPARGDLAHWRYELFDLAPLLHVGENLITATVWNWGIFAPVAQMSDRTAFLLESEATGDEGISTPAGWQVEIEDGHRALDRSSVDVKAYFASGPGEEINAALYDWDWNDAARGVSPVAPAAGPIGANSYPTVSEGQPASHSAANWVEVASPMRDSTNTDTNKASSADMTVDNSWGLVPDALPHMEYAPTDVGKTVRVDVANRGAVAPELNGFPSAPVTVPVGSHVHILLDRKTLTTAYPILTVSGGKGAQIWLTYSEALYDQDVHKGDRDEVGDRAAHGLKDSFLPDGGKRRVFEPLWWRTWRYLDLDIQTAGDPLTLDSLQARFTAYPFKEQATLPITRCATERDLGDQLADGAAGCARDLHGHAVLRATAIRGRYADTGADLLCGGRGRPAGAAGAGGFRRLAIPDGLTRSRYPSSLPQTIPTFSLLWVGMVRDWWMYRPDAGPALESLPGTRAVMDWFAQYEQPDGLLKQLPWWSFIDWVPAGAIPTYDANGESCMTTLEYLGALEDAAALEKGLGDPLRATRYESRATHVRSGLSSKCWNSVQGLLTETPGRNDYSQQANILGVLYDVVPKERQQGVMRRMLVVDPGRRPREF